MRVTGLVLADVGGEDSGRVLRLPGEDTGEEEEREVVVWKGAKFSK